MLGRWSTEQCPALTHPPPDHTALLAPSKLLQQSLCELWRGNLSSQQAADRRDVLRVQQLSRMPGDLSVLGQTLYHDKSSSFVLLFLGSGRVLGLSLRSFSFLSSVFSFPGGESAVDLAGSRLQRKTGSEKKNTWSPLL